MTTVRIEVRRDTAANWTLANPVLALGEPGLETDTRLVKYGDGVTVWTGLSYAGASGLNGIDGAPGIMCPPFSYTGTLSVWTGQFRWYNDSGHTLTVGVVRASAGTAPTGASIIVDVIKNGTTLFTGGTGRPTIAAATVTATGTPAVTSVANGDYLTISITQVGSTVAGADLTVVVNMT